MKKGCTLFVLLPVLMAFSPAPVYSGQLDDYEKAATKDDLSDQDKRSSIKKEDNDTDDDSIFGDILGDVISGILGIPVQYTMARVGKSVSDPADEEDYGKIHLRRVGEPDIPFLRTDFNYQHVNSQINGADVRIETGYGAFGVQVRETHYHEIDPDDSLDMVQIHGLLRFSGSRAFEMDFGIGPTMLMGDHYNEGISLTVPINVEIVRSLSLRFRPTWNWINSASSSDYDSSLALSRRFFSIQLGYRTLRADHERLNGPYFGVSFYY